MKLISTKKASSKGLDTIIEKLRRRPRLSLAILQATFLLLSVALYFVILTIGKGNWSVDGIFHWERAKEVALDFQHGIWPQFNQFTGYSGIADETFYPWLTWVPFALLTALHVPPVFIMDLLAVGGMYMGLNIAYYSFKSYDHSHLKALTFALLYCTSSIMVNLQFMQSENAEYLSIMIAPMVFFGWLRIMHGERKYRMFVTGLVLMTFTHLFSPLLLLIALGLLTAMSYSKVNKAKFVTFAKAGGIFLLTTASVWLPIIVLMKTNVIYRPQLPSPMIKNANLLPLSIAQVFRSAETLWNIPEIAAFIMAICKWKKLSYYGKRIFIVSVLILIMNAQFLPWHFLQHTVVGQLQFPFRLSFILRMFLIYIFAELIRRNWKHADRDIRVILVVVFTLLNLVISYKSEAITKGKPYHDHIQKFSEDNVYGVSKDVLGRERAGKKVPIKKAGVNSDTYVLNNHELNHPKTLKMVTNADYAQKNYIDSSNKAKTAITHRDISHVTNVGDKITYTAGGNYHHVEIPVMLYNAQKYNFYIDGHPVGYQRTKYNKPTLNNVPKGRHVITFRTPMMWYYYVAVLATLVGFYLLAMPTDLKRLRRKYLKK